MILDVEVVEVQVSSIFSPKFHAIQTKVFPLQVGSVKTLHLWANFSDVKLWFDWAEDDCETTVVPPLGKTKLPPWHFKMLKLEL